jgi:hypothetical protein
LGLGIVVIVAASTTKDPGFESRKFVHMFVLGSLKAKRKA